MSNPPPLLPFVSFPAKPPGLPVPDRPDPTQPDLVVRAEVIEVTHFSVRLAGVAYSGRAVRIEAAIVAPGVAHVLLCEEPDPIRVTLACLPQDADRDDKVVIERSDGCFTLIGEDIIIRVNLEPFHLVFSEPGGRELLEQNAVDSDVTNRPTVLPFGMSDFGGRRVAFHDSFTAEPDEHYYGFGEKFTGLDKRGQRLEMWNVDAFGVHSERAYKNVPFFLSSRGYGIFVDSVRCIHFDMAASNHAVFSIIVPDSALDYYVIAGQSAGNDTLPDLKSILTRYARLVSFPTLPPRWAFGLWMSSGFKSDNAATVLARAAALREQMIPCDVLHIDAYWQRFGCWSDMIWDPERFPDPSGMIAQLKSMGYRVSLWMNSYLGIHSERFAEAAQKGYLLKDRFGEVIVADLWSGDHPPVGIIDMTHPQAVAWFKELLRPLLRSGVDVFKTDFGEGVPVEAVAYNGMTGEQLHNLYTLLYNDAVAQVTFEETGHWLVWGRSTYAGGQRHAAQWGGDPNSTYPALASTLRGGLSFGLSGHPFWSHDIGGFHGAPPPDLYVRWAQFGLLSPLSRMHGMTTRLPWDFGEEALRIVREFLRLRYRLMPYLYTCAQESAETGVPLLRAMLLEFPNDPNTYGLDLQ